MLFLTLLLFGISSVTENRVQAQAPTFTAGQIEVGAGCEWPYNAVAVNPSDKKIYGFWRKGAGTTAIYKLIRWDGSSWSTVSTFSPSGGSSASQVPNFERAYDDVNLAIDATGAFHVVFQGAGGDNFSGARGVWYGYSANGTSWAFTAIQTFSDPSGFKNTYDPVIELDASNHPHIVFLATDANNPRQYTLRYYQNTGSGWSGQDAFSQPGGVRYNNEINGFDFALDGNGKAHVAFQRETNDSGLDGGLWYVTNSSGSWTAPIVIAAGTQGQVQGTTISMDVDGANKVHILYTGYPGGLHHATNTSGSFTITTLGGVTGSVRPHSFQFNSLGDKFVALGGHKYAYQLSGTTGDDNWTSGTAYSGGAGGGFFSGLLSPARRIMLLFDYIPTGVSCNDANPRSLWYATAALSNTPTAAAPTVSTSGPAISISATNATIGGTLTSDGGSGITSYGVVYIAGTGTPTITNNKVQVGTSSPSSFPSNFSASLTSLTPNTQYTAQAYATNSVNTSYGNPVTFTTNMLVTDAPVLNNPANNSLLNTRTPVYQGTALAGSLVTLYVRGAAIGTTTATSSNTFFLTQPTNLTDGQYSVYATAQLSGQIVSNNSNSNLFTIDATPPTVSIASAAGASGSITSTSPIAFTATFSETVSTFSANKLQVTNGTVGNFMVSGTSYRFSVTPNAGGGLTVSIPTNAVTDPAGNGNLASTFSLTYLAPQTITFGPLAPVTYGSSSFSLTATASSGLPVGYLSSDPTVAIVNGQGVVSVLKVGTTTITASQSGNGQYAAATSVPQVLSVTPVPLTIIANNICQAYGSSRPTLTASYSGFVNGDTPASLSTQATVSTSASANAPGGTYTVVAFGAVSNNYTFVYFPGILTIVQPSLVASGTLTCAVTSISLTAGGGSNYRLSNAQGAIQTNTTGYFMVSTNGLYSLTAIAPNGCSATTTTMVVSNTTAPAVNIQPSALTSCAGQRIQLLATGGDTYQWSTGPTTATISVTATGTFVYSVTATNAVNGCSASASQPITIKPLPAPPGLLTAKGQSYPAGVSSLTVSLNTSPVILTVSGCIGGRITWNGGGNTSLPVSTSALGTQTFQAICTTDGCSSPAALASVTVVPTTLGVLYRDADYGNTGNAIIKPYLKLSNASNEPIPYNEITVRYWFTSEGNASPTNLAVYYAPMGVNMTYVALAQPSQGAYGYVEYSLNGDNLGAQSISGAIENGIQKSDNSNFNETDDYSYLTNYQDFVPNPHITAYRNGVLFWGQEPTPVASQTAVSVYSAAKDGTTTSQIQTRVEVRNEGNAPITVSDLKLRYYFTSDNGQPATVYVDYADLGASNVQARVVTLASPVNGADSYVELTFLAGVPTLAPQSSLGAVDFRIVRSDYGLLDQTNDYSYAANYGNVGLNNHVTVYLNNNVVFGIPPSGAARVAAREPVARLAVKVMGNPVTGSVAQLVITGAEGQAVSLRLVDVQGRTIHEQSIEQASETESVSVPVGQSRGTLLLKVSTDSQQQSLKLVRP